jgi:tRNA A-37 threonylcarbamoyl transferase component Bud32
MMGGANHSVLKALGKTIDLPRVVLREAAAEGREPVVWPKSPEMPDRGSDTRYQLHGEISRGGMGAILKGRDPDLGRELAIKVLLDEHKDKPEAIHRFVEEAQIGGQLQHPGIAPVYELGQFADKRPFFAMKLVKGETLLKLLADRADASADRGKFLAMFAKVCDTMAYAHSRGVIHRDLKPANIMVGAFGEVQVVDWGLAKVLTAGGLADEKKSRQQEHAYGSRRAEPVESLGGRHAAIDPPSDGAHRLLHLARLFARWEIPGQRQPRWDGHCLVNPRLEADSHADESGSGFRIRHSCTSGHGGGRSLLARQQDAGPGQSRGDRAVVGCCQRPACRIAPGTFQCGECRGVFAGWSHAGLRRHRPDGPPLECRNAARIDAA